MSGVEWSGEELVREFGLGVCVCVRVVGNL